MPTHKTAHLQTAQAETQSKICKRAVFFCRHTDFNSDIYELINFDKI